MVKQLINLSEKANNKLKEIKEYLRFGNIDQAIEYIIGFYAKEMEVLKKEDAKRI